MIEIVAVRDANVMDIFVNAVMEEAEKDFITLKRIDDLFRIIVLNRDPSYCTKEWDRDIRFKVIDSYDECKKKLMEYLNKKYAFEFANNWETPATREQITYIEFKC